MYLGIPTSATQCSIYVHIEIIYDRPSRSYPNMVKGRVIGIYFQSQQGVGAVVNYNNQKIKIGETTVKCEIMENGFGKVSEVVSKSLK